MSIFGFPFLERHLTVSFQHCISLPQACIDSDVTVLRRDPALECVIPSTAINSTHFTLRYTSQTAHDVKKRRVDIEEEERLRTFASSGGVPAPRQQKPVSSSGKPAASKGTAAKDVSFKDGIVPSFLVPVVPDALAGARERARGAGRARESAGDDHAVGLLVQLSGVAPELGARRQVPG
jgi:hypothetical protein